MPICWLLRASIGEENDVDIQVILPLNQVIHAAIGQV